MFCFRLSGMACKEEKYSEVKYGGMRRMCRHEGLAMAEKKNLCVFRGNGFRVQ